MSVEHHGALPASYRLQEYRVERVLGFGGFGSTYLATDTHLNKLVAIKEYLPAALALRSADASVVPSARENAEDFRCGLDRFINEARALARFRHYEGHMVKGVFTGFAVMFMADGDRFEGEFRDNKRTGYGILYLPGGTRRSGLWHDNLLVKPD